MLRIQSPDCLWNEEWRKIILSLPPRSAFDLSSSIIIHSPFSASLLSPFPFSPSLPLSFPSPKHESLELLVSGVGNTPGWICKVFRLDCCQIKLYLPLPPSFFHGSYCSVVNFRVLNLTFKALPIWTSASLWRFVCVQSCPILCNPMDCSPPGFSVHGISQTRILEWVAIPFSRGSSWPRDQTLSPAWQADTLPMSRLGSPFGGLSSNNPRCHPISFLLMVPSNLRCPTSPTFAFPAPTLFLSNQPFLQCHLLHKDFPDALPAGYDFSLWLPVLVTNIYWLLTKC